MEITINPQAAKWFKEEVGLKDGFGIRFKSRIYGSSPINDGFSIGIEPDVPLNPIASTKVENGIMFFIEENDEWFFNGYDLYVDFDEKLREPKYIYNLRENK